MQLSDFIKEEQIEIGFEANSKDDILKEISRLAKLSPLAKKYSAEEIYYELKEREKLSSTGLGNEIAIPHCTLKKLDDFIVGIITLKNPVDFEAIDDKKVKLIMFVIAPDSDRSQYIRMLSKISGVLKNKDNVREILASKSPEILKENFLKNLEFFPEQQKRKEFVQIDVIIQDEDIFLDILETFTEVEDSSIVVLDTENAGYYLYSSPLFANLWSEKEKKFNRMIIAIVPKNITNELIRNLEKQIKKIKSGVLITMHNIIYSAGSLEI